ncbi:hypothetical protein ACIRPT_05345 [Streptomyces sp. NPDC101227]|uniref:hypothetical protein n=1 Tax=Streptomyces sp. NPDC101227 TaxID=3366136 RepID=UPI0038053243
MLIRLRRPWRARLAVTCTVLLLATAGATLLLRDIAPPPYKPPPRLPRTSSVTLQVAYGSELDRDAPPGPATITGAVMLAVAGGLGVGGCLICRRR